VPGTAIHWQREELAVDDPSDLEEPDARARVIACLQSGKVPPPDKRRRWGGLVEMAAQRFRVTLVKDTVAITGEGEEGCE